MNNDLLDFTTNGQPYKLIIYLIVANQGSSKLAISQGK